MNKLEPELIGVDFSTKPDEQHEFEIPPTLDARASRWAMGEDPIKLRTANVLEDMAKTFRQRNTEYGDNYQAVGRVMVALFPDGIHIKTYDDFVRWHWIDWAVGKLTRFINSGMTHIDSIHDCAVYLTMIRDYTQQMQERMRDDQE